MSFDDYREILIELKSNEIFLLTLSGGEPFLHPNINEMLDIAHLSFEHVTVLTNGTVLQDEHFKSIERIAKKKGFFPIQVSLDSTSKIINDDTRGQTDRVVENLKILNKIGANITIALVLSSRNIDAISETIASLIDITRHFHVMPIKSVPFLKGTDDYLQVDPERLNQAWHELIELRDQYGVKVRTPIDDLCKRVETSACGAPCMAGFTKLAIDPNLDVRPCDKCISAVVGNLKRESLEEIWNSDQLASVYQRNFPYCYCVSNRQIKSSLACQ